MIEVRVQALNLLELEVIIVALWHLDVEIIKISDASLRINLKNGA
jgi:hypothetical protein